MMVRVSAFIFPAIVDRSPLIVAVGTAGSSPSLARRVRAQIEALLPERLGQLADYAGGWREAVRRALPEFRNACVSGMRFFGGPVANSLLAGNRHGADAAMQAALDRARAAATTTQGEAYLIGVGPGDPDLLTLRAQQLLQQADVVLYDRLVPETILGRARRDALKINVGKVPGKHEHTQDYINALLLEHTRAGRRVARVKGGDPFVFGRGGEELAVLREAGIPTVVVPGITAALGAAASASLPLTHRGIAQAVTFVTATGAQAVQLDWRAARPATAHRGVLHGCIAGRVHRAAVAGARPRRHHSRGIAGTRHVARRACAEDDAGGAACHGGSGAVKIAHLAGGR